MMLVLAILFLVLPFVELAVIVGVADSVGLGWTILLLVGVSLAGAWLVKREGLGVYRRVQAQVGAGEVPTTELINGALILFAGALLLTPGFVTDVVGLLLLLPPTRAVVRRLLAARFRKRFEVELIGGVPSTGRSARFGGRGGVVDVDEVTTRHHGATRLTRQELDQESTDR